MHRKNRQPADKLKHLRRTAAEAPLERGRDKFSLRRQRSAVCVFSGHPVVLAQLEGAIDNTAFQVQAERLKSFGSGLDNTPGLPEVQLCVLDALGPRQSSAAVIQQILQASPDARILLVAENDAEEDCFELLLLGARGLLTYGETAEQLTQALRCIAGGGFWLSPLRLSRFVDSFLGRFHLRKLAGSVLSRRENEIVQMLFKTWSNKEIANELNISERTVKFHVSNLLQKFGVHSRMELVLSYGPPPPTALLAGFARHVQPERENPSGQPHSKPRFLGVKDQDKDILPISRHPAYSVS